VSKKSYKRNTEQEAFVAGAVKVAEEAYARMEEYDADKKQELANRAKRACRHEVAS